MVFGKSRLQTRWSSGLKRGWTLLNNWETYWRNCCQSSSPRMVTTVNTGWTTCQRFWSSSIKSDTPDID